MSDNLVSKWQQLAEQAGNEKDTKKLIQIIRELCEELDAGRSEESTQRRPAASERPAG